MVYERLISGLDSILDPIFRPILGLGTLVAVIVISVTLAILMTFIYKWATNQVLMKELKEKIKHSQQKMKEHKSNPEKVMEIQKEAMQVNTQYMMQSLKPTLWTFLPVILIFGWLAANVAYEPIYPGQEFTTTVLFEKGVTGEVSIILPEELELLSEKVVNIQNREAQFSLRGPEGNYLLRYEYNGNLFTKDLLITTVQKYERPIQPIKNDFVKQIAIDNVPLKFNFGFFRLGWLWTYILVSIIVSMGLRKLLKIH